MEMNQELTDVDPYELFTPNDVLDNIKIFDSTMLVLSIIFFYYYYYYFLLFSFFYKFKL